MEGSPNSIEIVEPLNPMIKEEQEILDDSMLHHSNMYFEEPDGELDVHYNKAYTRDIKLLEAYKSFPQLYDRDNPDFRYATRKEAAWKNLSKQVGLPIETCRKRITYIRARFTVERRLIKNGQHSDWPLMEKLKFLHKHIQMRRLNKDDVVDNQEAETEIDDEPPNNPSSTSYFQNNSTNHNNGHSIFGNSRTEDEYKSRKRRHSQMLNDDFDSQTVCPPFTHHMSVVPEVTTPNDCRDQHQIFGEYVAEVVRKLPKQIIPQTTLKLMQVLIDAQEHTLQLEKLKETATAATNSVETNKSSVS